MKINTSVFEHEGAIPSHYTCDGEDVNPPLEIADVPKDAKSLVILVDDPGAPASTWVHWLVWNISPDTAEMGENSLPDGAVEGITSFNKTGYGGPCPPSGVHRYYFKLFALDTILELEATATANEVKQAMSGHILEQVELMGRYQR